MHPAAAHARVTKSCDTVGACRAVPAGSTYQDVQTRRSWESLDVSFVFAQANAPAGQDPADAEQVVAPGPSRSLVSTSAVTRDYASIRKSWRNAITSQGIASAESASFSSDGRARRNQWNSSSNVSSRSKLSSSVAWRSTPLFEGALSSSNTITPSPLSSRSDFNHISNFARSRSVPTTTAEETDAGKGSSSRIVASLGVVAHTLFADVSSTHRPNVHKETAPQSPRETYVVYSDAYWRTYAHDQFRKHCFDYTHDRITGLPMGFAS